MKPRLRAEWVVLSEQRAYYSELLFESREEKFSFRRVESSEISSHPLQNIVKVRNASLSVSDSVSVCVCQ